jgi:hypothetical protein
MEMMAATHAAAGLAGGFLVLLFALGVGLYLWARR